MSTGSRAALLVLMVSAVVALVAAGRVGVNSLVGSSTPAPVQFAAICDVDPTAFASFLRAQGPPVASQSGDSGIADVEECSHAWGSADAPSLVVDVSRGPDTSEVEEQLRASDRGSAAPSEPVDIGHGLSGQAVGTTDGQTPGVLTVVCRGGGHSWRLRAAAANSADVAAGVGDLAGALGCGDRN